MFSMRRQNIVVQKVIPEEFSFDSQPKPVLFLLYDVTSNLVYSFIDKILCAITHFLAKWSY